MEIPLRLEDMMKRAATITLNPVSDPLPSRQGKPSASADFPTLEGTNDTSGFSIYVAALYKKTQARSGYFHCHAIGK